MGECELRKAESNCQLRVMSPMRYLFSIPLWWWYGELNPGLGCSEPSCLHYTISPFVPRRGIEPRLPALQTGALPTELSWRKECFRYIHKPFVDWEGIEPSIQVCKTRVFPLALPAHFEIAVELNHDCPRLTIYPETISTSQKGIGIEPPSIIHTACQISHQTICDVFLCRV